MVKFFEIGKIDDALLRFAVIVTKTEDKWVFCKHRERETYECPGGHREPGKNIYDTAKRELYEETGAIDFDIKPLCVYCVCDENECSDASYGMICFAHVKTFEKELHSEIEKIVITQSLPEKWTYPDIQPFILEETKRRLASEEMK